MFAIEILTVSADLEKPIALAIHSLNGIQKEFHFGFPSPELVKEAELMHRTTYQTEDIFAWMRKYRAKAKGQRPYLILVVDGPLSSPRMNNLFGSHEATEGLATFTTDNSSHFVHDVVRYIRYYFVRYSLSFLAPDIKTHAEARACFFDKKIAKNDIKLSVDTGGLCDPCRSLLTDIWSPSIKRAIEDMGRLIAGDYPYALIMKGGGVKGLAFAGAMLELENYFTFDVFAGSSAGSIAALLFAADYSPSDLSTELKELDFSTFKDASRTKAFVNFIRKRGLYSADTLTEWIGGRLKTKLKSTTEIRMKDLPSRAVVYASSPKLGLLTFDTKGDRQETLAAFAARCSASIPYYFIRQSVDGESVYDGGLRENFPFERFLQENYGKPTIGLYLTSAPRRSRLVLGDIIEAMTNADDPNTIRKYSDKIVPIDPSPIKTTDFDLTEREKELLILAGRAAAQRYLLNQGIDGGPTSSDVLNIETQTQELRTEVARQRNRRL
jgi:predicted acylesterase/phospholipase RssA